MQPAITKAIQQIKRQGIRPESRVRSAAKRYVKWLLFVLVAFLGALSISAIAYVVGSLDWDTGMSAGKNPLIYMLSLVPYFWIFFGGIFLVLAYWELRNTESGYRYSIWRIVFSVSAIFSVFSIGAFLLGAGSEVNQGMMRNFPLYASHMVVTKESQWTRPNDGFLSGDIVAVGSGEVTLTDLQGKTWVILFGEDTTVRALAKIEVGSRIKLIGMMRDGATFFAREIRPWNGMGMMGQGVQHGVGMGKGMMGR